MKEVVTVDGQRLRISSKGVVRTDDDLSGDVDVNQIKLCERWFRQASATATPTLNSFWLQHFVQNWAGSPISHGALIIAAHHAGFPIGREREDATANVTIGVATDCVDQFDCGCGHP